MANLNAEPAPRTAGTARPKKTATRPKKPYADFPLGPHASGTWQKKIRGKIHYFGKWGRVVDGVMTRVPGDGWKEALAQYKAVADDLHAGRTPREAAGEFTVMSLCNHFLTAKQRQTVAGELSPRTFAEYKATTDRLVKAFGKTRLVSDLATEDFERLRSEIAATNGPTRLGIEVQKVRTVFKYGYEAGLIDKPVRYGPQFKKPSKKVMRVHRAAGGKRVFDADELRRLVAAAGVPMRAMVLLGINAAFGNADCGRLPLACLDLDGGWVEFPRPKTGVERRCPLWPETVAALREAVAARPEPKGPAAAGLVFVTKYGQPWSCEGTSAAVTHETAKLLRKLGIHRSLLGFYALRHTFRTVADAVKDPNAIRLVMGHTDERIDDHYTHGIADDRLQSVADHVRRWLFETDAAA